MQSAPHNLSVLSNYAEFLLGLGRIHQAKLAALRAREHPEAHLPDNADMRAAMSFAVFSSHVLMLDRQAALGELDEMKWQVEAAAERARAASAPGNNLDTWTYQGIRRTLEKRLLDSLPWQRTAILHALSYIESGGEAPVFQELRQLLASESEAV